jgi:prepilin-type N-terminal cleavage/methylation domain-containing protein
MKTTIKPQNGFTLVEVLVAAAILAVGLLAVSTMIARSTIQDSRAYYLTKASMLVEEIIEQESHKQYTAAAFSNIQSIVSSKTIDGITYSIDCNVQNGAPFSYCKEMTCTVRWNNKGLQGNTRYIYDFCKYD